MIKKNHFLLFVLILSFKTIAQNIKLGDSLMAVGQFTKAIELYDKNEHFSKYYKIAKAYEARENNKLAYNNYKKYLENDSLNLSVNYNFGLLLLKLSKYNEAQNVFQKIVNKNPTEVYLYYLGLALEKNNDLLNATKYYMLSAKRDSLYFKSNYKLAVFYSQTNNFKESLKITNRFLKIDNENIDMLKLQSQVYFAESNYKKAISDFEKLIALNQTDDFIFEKLALSFYATKEYKKAIEIYDSLLEKDEENADYFFNRGKCYGQLNQLKKAENDIKNSIELKTFTFENEYFILGYFYQKQENYKEALLYYTKTLKEDKNHSEAAYQVIAIKDYNGQSASKSIQDYEKYLLRFPDVSTTRKNQIEKRLLQLKR